MIKQDILHRFLFEELGVRGEWIKLGASWQAARQHQQGTPFVQELLGQALAAVTMLSATVKFSGSMILQAQGDGNIKTLVAQATHDRKIRGLVRSHKDVDGGSLTTLFGQGRLVLTIEMGDSDPYQGIVPLEGENLANALETYFLQSEQLKTRLWLFADQHHAAGLLLQELPEQKHFQADWERIEMLANTITRKELLELDCEQVLHRLFNEEKVRLFDPEPIAFQCACSRPRIGRTLRAMGRPELEDILREQHQIEVICEFCGAHYLFDKVDVESILSQDGWGTTSETRH
ncbi:MAG: Hsp33 family molecular chaperone HslO [Methylovulum miyakonense]|uniref:Hsp33 family molecular chaperone HslO n=1 Tax=Methylovulum miyakonense TaxID=645578 RepID=UPI003BB61AA6